MKFQYIGDNNQPPQKIKFMGKYEFELNGEPVEVNQKEDPVAVNKLQRLKTFKEVKVSENTENSKDTKDIKNTENSKDTKDTKNTKNNKDTKDTKNTKNKT